MFGNNYRFVKLWLLSTVFYFLLFASVSDLYFKSPIHHGLTPQKGPPIAKRVVLIVADGLRYESLIKHKEYTPFLTRLGDHSAHGVVHTKVPTESRPGHAALLGGIYEDPSAVFSGWKKNIVNFDTVVNQSMNVWAYGSPDIVPAYTKKDESKLVRESYSSVFQDFSGSGNTTILDNWVFDKIRDLLHFNDKCSESSFKVRQSQREVFAGIDANCDKCPEEFLSKKYCCLEDDIIRSGHQLTPSVNALFKTIRLLKTKCSGKAKTCEGAFCESGNLIFLHLLGMDSAGHIHKPNNINFLQTLNNLDKGVEKTVNLIEDFFNDDETAYIFTADHGMTDWGSHGDGSDMETEVPLLMWGKGIQHGSYEFHLQQADIAPMVSILLGVPVPTNSIGFIEHRILQGTKENITKALLTNLAQLIELYNFKRIDYDNDFCFKDMVYFRHKSPSDYINELRTKSHVEANVIKEVAQAVLNGIKYLNDYYFTPKMAMVWYGFILWMIYLTISLHESKTNFDPAWSKKFVIARKWFQLSIASLALSIAVYAFNLRTPYFSYFYIIFPSLMTIWIVGNKRLVYDIYKFNKKHQKTTVITQILILIILIQMLVLGFSYKYIYGVVMLILILWVYTFKTVQKQVKHLWAFANICLTGCLLIPHNTSFQFDKFYVGAALWIPYYLITLYVLKLNHWKDMKFAVIYSGIPLIFCFITIINVLIVAYQFEYNGVLSGPRIVSWIITVASMVSIPFCPNSIMLKFNYICGSLAVPFISMSFNYDIISFTILVLWLNLWIVIETKINNKINIFQEKYSTTMDLNNHTVNFDNYRSSFFYIAITICYFFAIGNVASFSGFDPLWSRAYISTFSPFLMASLIMFKIIIPFFLITCAYLAINTIQQRNVMKVFTIIMLQLNQMILNFMLHVRNEGSWKEIGQSLSHFIVMEVMAIVLLTFYMISKYVAGFCLPSNAFFKKRKQHM